MQQVLGVQWVCFCQALVRAHAQMWQLLAITGEEQDLTFAGGLPAAMSECVLRMVLPSNPDCPEKEHGSHASSSSSRYDI